MFKDKDFGFFLGNLVHFNQFKVCVEVGVAEGHTTDYFCHGVKSVGGHVYGFDLWETHGLWNQFPTFSTKEKVEQYLKSKGHSNFTLTKANTKTDNFSNILDNLCPKIDFAFIDACHSYEGIKNDFDIVYPKMTDSGVIVFHDTTVIDGCREFAIDLRDKFYDGTFDLIDMPFGNGARRCGLLILKKRTYNHGIKIDEICGSPSKPEQIYAKENLWLLEEQIRVSKE